VCGSKPFFSFLLLRKTYSYGLELSAGDVRLRVGTSILLLRITMILSRCLAVIQPHELHCDLITGTEGNSWIRDTNDAVQTCTTTRFSDAGSDKDHRRIVEQQLTSSSTRLCYESNTMYCVVVYDYGIRLQCVVPELTQFIRPNCFVLCQRRRGLITLYWHIVSR
jgi:hypothetical protein